MSPDERILVVDDDPITRRLLVSVAREVCSQVEQASDGLQAWRIMSSPDPPRLVLLDWLMDGYDGVTLCTKLRCLPLGPRPHVIMVTVRDEAVDLVAALEAGADDYVVKPFARETLRARLRAGLRIISLQRQLSARIEELEAAREEVRQLQSLLHICAYCHRICTEDQQWERLETYMSTHTDVQFSHGICPACMKTVTEEEGLAPGA